MAELVYKQEVTNEFWIVIVNVYNSNLAKLLILLNYLLMRVCVCTYVHNVCARTYI